MEIVNMDGVFDNSAASGPDCEAAWMVVPTIILMRQSSLGVDRTGSASHSSRIIEETVVHGRVIPELLIFALPQCRS